MKLFTKTLLFFISAIVFQSALTILLITNITTRNNREDALQELRQEAGIVFEDYNSWKRRIWKTLIALHQEPPWPATPPAPDSAQFQKTLLRTLQDSLSAAGLDLLIVKHAAHSETDIVAFSYNNFSLAELQGIRNQKAHPYIELRVIGAQLCMIGITRLEPDTMPLNAPAVAPVDLFLVKRLDREFCKQLVLNRSTHVAFFLDDQYFSATLPQDLLAEIVGEMALEGGARDLASLTTQEPGYNVAVQKIDILGRPPTSHKLFLVTVVSNAPYLQRLAVLERTMLSVTGLSALLTIGLSLFFSRNMTRPIKNLLAAMQNIRRGHYDTTIESAGHDEIGSLFRGFNEMAGQLLHDQQQMRNFIQEITVLKDYNEQVIQSIRAGLLIVNRAMSIEKVNNAFLDAFGVQEADVLGQPLADVALDILASPIPESVQAILSQRADEAAHTKRTTSNRVYDIKLYPVETHDVSGREAREPRGCVCVFNDISRKIEFEEKIFQAEKLSSISMLSAGVAHEINNPLGSIMTNVQNLIEDEDDADRQIALQWIEQETRRIAVIVRELLNFASSDREQPGGADVNALVAEMVQLITYSVKKTQAITIRTELEADLPLAVISPDELKQVILNLLKNAMQAVAEEGEIVIKTEQNRQPQTIGVTIIDNGVGISEAQLPRIFDPFYTTKQTGEGTGLGLSVVYGIINKYQGRITVDSTAGAGTQIHLTLPVWDTE